MGNDDFLQQSSSDMMEKRTQGVKNKASAMATKGMNKVGKAGAKVAKTAGKAVVKAALAAIKMLILTLGPFLAIVLLIVFLGALAYMAILENKGSDSQYSTTTENVITVDETTGKEVLNVASESRKIKKFYTYVAGQSYSIKVGDKEELLSPDDSTLRDYHKREKTFRLNRDLLYALDSNLYNDVFRYPEQFVKNVSFDPATMKLKHLTDDVGTLTATSKKRDPISGEILNEEIKSVRDYGLGSVIKFVDPDVRKFYKVDHLSFKYTTEQYYDETEQKVKIRNYVPATATDAPNADGYHYDAEAASPYKEEINLIDSVVSISGNIKYEYDDDVVNGHPTRELNRTFRACTTDVASNEECDQVEYSSYEESYEVPMEDKEGNPVLDEKGKQKTETKKRDVPLYRTRTGGVYTLTPRTIVKETNDEGDKYLRDFMSYFEANIPNTVINGKTIEERMDEDSYIFDTVDAELMDIEGFTVGSSATSSNVMRAIQEGEPYFTKYAARYGIDAKLLIAQAAQESGGNHNRYISAQRCETAGCGIMQVERPGKVITSLTANLAEGGSETMEVTYEKVKNIEYNIQAGAMEFTHRLQEWNGNVLLALQSYNFGSYGKGGGMYALSLAVKQGTGNDLEYYKNNPQDTSWMAYRQNVYSNPNAYGMSWSGATYGDPLYVEHVLRYYSGDELEYVTSLPEGETDGGSDGFINGIGNAIKDLFKNPFKKKEPSTNTTPTTQEVAEPVTEFRSHTSPINYETIMTIAKIMSTKALFSEATSESELTMFDQGFISGLQTEGITSEEFLAKFPQATNYKKPLAVENPRITSPYGQRGEYLHKGTDIGVPIGTSVYAVADGTVYLARCDSKGCGVDAGSGGKMIWITNDDGTQARYLHLDSYLVKAGDRVTAGQEIGKSGNSGNGQAHLHFEFHNTKAPDSSPVDSTFFFKN